MNPTIGQPVTITLSKESYSEPKSIIVEGMKIKLGRDSWYLFNTRIKNRLTVARLFRKTFNPYLIVTEISTDIPYEHKLTVKPYNF